MNEAEKYDGRIAESWKANSDGLLVFVRPSLLLFPLFIVMTTLKTGLFSATVGAFIIEFYKKLSPDSGGQTVDLLCEISQQFSDFTNRPARACSPPQTSQSFSPSASIVWVISLWMISLILSLSSALFATLLQQWARRYVQMPQIPGPPKDRACVRSFLFFGTRKYQMRMSIETAPALLHLSVLFFFAGVVILFYDIHTTVANIVSLFVSIVALAYFSLTFLPYFRHDCLYRTPMSNMLWYIAHASLFSAAICLHRFLGGLHSFLVGANPGSITSDIQRFLVRSLETLGGVIKKHKQRLKDGFGDTIVQRLKQLSDTNVYLEALTWWLQLPSMDEESKAQQVLTCIPRDTVVQLMGHYKGRSVFLEHLLTLLRSCEPGSSSTGLAENERRIRLLMCLRTIHSITLDSDFNDNTGFIRRNFAEFGRMQAMWAHSDPEVRITSRSICASLARYLLRTRQFERSQLAWLRDVTGEEPRTIFGADPDTQARMNLKAFVFGVLAHQQGDLPAEHATSFTESLANLMDAGTQRPFDSTAFRTRLPVLIADIQQSTAAGSAEIVDKFDRMFSNI
jgi:hypothetical protein